jgi:hypothetical protein
LSLYVNRQTIEDKDKRQNVVVILETSKRRFIVCIDLKEKGYAVVLGGCPYKPSHKPKWKFFYFNINKLGNSLLSNQCFTPIIHVLAPCPLVKSQIKKVEKIVTNSNFQHVVNMRLTQTEASLGVCEC